MATKTTAQKFMTARANGKAGSFSRNNGGMWLDDGRVLAFDDGSAVYIHDGPNDDVRAVATVTEARKILASL